MYWFLSVISVISVGSQWFTVKSMCNLSVIQLRILQIRKKRIAECYQVLNLKLY